MSDIAAFLTARYDEREAWARGASRPYPYADEGAVAPATGVHWRWVAGENWDTVTPDPVGSEFVVESGYSCHLATVEEWPSTSRLDDGTVIRTSMMPLTYDDSIVEMDSAAAGHIVLNDPKYVLDDIASKRRIVDRYVRAWDNVRQHPEDMANKGAALVMLGVVKLLAAPFRAHPDFDPAWRVDG